MASPVSPQTPNSVSGSSTVTPLKKKGSSERLQEGGAVIDVAANQIKYSQALQVALAGGNFDARSWLKRPQRSGDEDADEQAAAIFRHKLKFLDLAMTQPKHLELALQNYENKCLGLGKSCQKSEPFWPATYVYFEKIPKYYKGEVVFEACQPFGLTEELYIELDNNQPSAVQEMFDYITALHGKSKIPPNFKEKLAMKEGLRRRIVQVGRVTLVWINAILDNFSKPLELHWARPHAGCYWLAKAGTDINLHHSSGEHVKWPAYYQVDLQNIPLQSNWSDEFAKLILSEDGSEEDEIPLVKKFKKSIGPRTPVLMNDVSVGIKAIADTLAAERKAELDKAQVTKTAIATISESIENNEKDRKRKQAQAALAKRAPQRKTRACGSVVLSAPAAAAVQPPALENEP